MLNYKPVYISKTSFRFCRYSIALLVWLSYFLQSKWILAIVCIVFLISAILKVKKAPMIRLYDITFNKIKPSAEVMVNENAIFFAHLVGLTMSCICLLLVITVHAPAVWYVILGFAVLKTISAFGFCPASKLYDCTLNGNCCVNKKGNETVSSC